MELIFVGGVHGVGKTTICTAVAPLMSALHCSAGSLIREVTGRDGGSAKAVTDVADDQNILVGAVRALSADRLLLDGHFCLIRPGGEIARISVDVFARLRPTVLAIISSDPAQIADRLQARDGVAYRVSEILALQWAEVEHAASVGRELGLELVRCDSSVPPTRVAELLAAGLPR